MNQHAHITREWQTLLTARQYQCVLLRELGWSQHQIARHLGLTRSTVQTHLANAATNLANWQRTHDQEPDQ